MTRITACIDSGVSMHACRTACPHALFRPMTCPLASQMIFMLSKRPSTRSCCESYTVETTEFATSRATNRRTWLLAPVDAIVCSARTTILRTTPTVTRSHDTDGPAIEENTRTKRVDAGDVSETGTAGVGIGAPSVVVAANDDTSRLYGPETAAIAGPKTRSSTSVAALVCSNTRAVPTSTVSSSSAPRLCMRAPARASVPAR